MRWTVRGGWAGRTGDALWMTRNPLRPCSDGNLGAGQLVEVYTRSAALYQQAPQCQGFWFPMKPSSSVLSSRLRMKSRFPRVPCCVRLVLLLFAPLAPESMPD